MRVLHVVGTRMWGGVDEHVKRLVLQLQAQGFEQVVACAYRGGLDEILPACGVRTQLIPMPYPAMDIDDIIRGGDRIAALLESESFDVVHSHQIEAEIPSALACALVGKRALVATVHNTARRGYRAPLGRRLGVTYICVSEAVRSGLLADGIAPDQTIVAYNDVDVSLFAPEARDEALRRSLGFGPEHFVFLTVSRLARHKHLQVLLAAARLTAQAEPDTRWLIVGDGPEEAPLRELTRSLGIGDRAQFLGHVDNTVLPALYASCDAHVLPSLYEAFGIVNLEAMACGLPIVVSDVGGHVELVTDGENGLVVPPDDANALADTMVRLARQRDMAAAVGRRGRQHVVEAYAVPRMAGAVAEIYRRVVSRAPAVEG